MREIRLYGSEGGEGSSLFPYPYQFSRLKLQVSQSRLICRGVRR